MKEVRNQRFTGEGRRLLGVYHFSGLHFYQCTFDACSFGFNHNRSLTRLDAAERIHMQDCVVNNCIVRCARIDDSTFVNIRGNLTLVWAPFLRHVTLSGRIENVMVHGIVSPSAKLELSCAADRREAFYRDVDWALDISTAEFHDFSVRTGGIPSRLIRRDANTQFVVLGHERLSVAAERALLSPYTRTTIEVMFEEGEKECLLVAPKLDRRMYAQVMRDAETLARWGVLAP